SSLFVNIGDPFGIPDFGKVRPNRHLCLVNLYQLVEPEEQFGLSLYLARGLAICNLTLYKSISILFRSHDLNGELVPLLISGSAQRRQRFHLEVFALGLPLSPKQGHPDEESEYNQAQFVPHRSPSVQGFPAYPYRKISLSVEAKNDLSVTV